MTKPKNSDVKIITFDENGNEVIEYVKPSATSTLKRKTRTDVPPIPLEYVKIVPAIRRKFEDRMPEETETLFKYFDMKSTYFLCSRVPSGTRVTLCGTEFILSYQYFEESDVYRIDESAKQEISNILFMHFFSDDGWIQKNIEYRDLNDDELFHKFDNRMYNVLRDAVPKAETDIIVDEENPQAQFKAEVKRPVIRAMSELKRDDKDTWEDEQDGADVVSQSEEMDAKGIDFQDPLREDSPIVQAKKIVDDLTDHTIGKDVEELPDILTFKKEKMREYEEHPEILINHIKRKYGEADLVSRWLENIFNVKDEWIRAIMMSKESFIQHIQVKYSDAEGRWVKEIAKESARYEAGRRLVGKTVDERNAILDEMFNYYKKYWPEVRRANFEESANLALGRINKSIKDGKVKQFLTKYIHMEYDNKSEQQKSRRK